MADCHPSLLDQTLEKSRFSIARIFRDLPSRRVQSKGYALCHQFGRLPDGRWVCMTSWHDGEIAGCSIVTESEVRKFVEEYVQEAVTR
jgi:hypothetical protein